jgi:DNA-binding NtrC family response regulator
MGDLYPAFAIMIVDDEQPVLNGIRTMLRSAGITHTLAIRESSQALHALEREDVGLILLDLTMPGLSGEKLIPLIKRDHPDMPIVVITGNSDVDKAVECMKAGVDDYVLKPDLVKLLSTVRRCVEIQELRRENGALTRSLLSSQPENPEAFRDIVTGDAGMLSLLRYIEAIGRTTHPVLITGETGVGKELVARAVHAVSGRSGEFVAVNTAGFDDTLFADTLFGHKAGAFTGAVEILHGLVERAARGSLSLDEIGELAYSSQIKLLRLLESREYYPLGSDVVRKSEARVIVATNRDLPSAIASGDFRKDLYYRLKTHQAAVPPLRDRPGDIPLLIGHFIETAAREMGRSVPAFSPRLVRLLKAYRFPGNVRELRAMIFDAVSRQTSGELPLETFERLIGDAAELEQDEEILTIRRTVDRLVQKAIERAEGNRGVAARLLGITPQALGQRLKRAGQS